MNSRWKPFRWPALGALLAAAPLAQAADETGKGYISPQIGYTWTDADRAANDDLYYGLGVGKHLSKHWSLELNGTRGKYDVAGGDLNLTTASLDALLVFNRAGAVSPFVSFGAGYIEDNFDPGQSEGGVLAQAGMGLLLDVAENSKGSFLFQLRPEVKARWDGNKSGASDHPIDYFAGVGLVFAFGRERAAPPVMARPTPQPAPPMPVQPPPPATPAAQPQVVALDTVQFDFDSAKVPNASIPALDELARRIQPHPRLKIEVQGHTDSSGEDAYNMQLSQHRADTVREYLISQGASPSQLSARGYGETRPREDNSTRAGRIANRRVEMEVVENPEGLKIERSR